MCHGSHGLSRDLSLVKLDITEEGQLSKNDSVWQLLGLAYFSVYDEHSSKARQSNRSSHEPTNWGALIINKLRPLVINVMPLK